jgi:hypothetical protein
VINNIIINNQIETPLINFNIKRSRNRNLRRRYEAMLDAPPFNCEFKDTADYYIRYCTLINETYNYFINDNPNIFNEEEFIFNSPEIIEMFLFYLADHI